MQNSGRNIDRLYKIAFLLCAMFFFWFSEMAIINNMKNVNSYTFPMIICIICIIFIATNLAKLDNSLINSLIIFFTIFIIRSIIAFKFDHVPFNDFEVYLESAKLLANGNIADVANVAYYKNFPELFGFIIWESILIKIFGYNLIALKIVNCIIAGCIGIIIYFISKKLNKEIGIMASFLYAIYPSQVIMTSVLTNQHLATLLYLLAILIIQYKIIDEFNIGKNLLWGSIVGVLICIGNIIRPIAPPIMIAIIIFFAINRFKLIKINYIAIAIVFIIPISFFMTGKLYDLTLYKIGLTESIGKSSDLRYKFIVGLNKDSNGQYSDKIMNEFWGADEEHRNDMFKDAINYNIKEPIILFDLIKEKMNVLFGIPDNSYYWLTNKNKEILMFESQNTPHNTNTINNINRYENIYNSAESSFNSILYFMAALGVLICSKNNKKEWAKLLILILMTYISVYCIIEVQARYRYFLMPFIIIFASYSMIYINNYAKNKFIKSKF